MVVYSWNPRRRPWKIPFGPHIGPRRPVNNFGDLLGPLIVDHLLTSNGLPSSAALIDPGLTIFTVGSVLSFASDGDVIWGSGLNGKIPSSDHKFSTLDVRAVRGPRTQEFLRRRGIDCPDVFGDPALLLPLAMPDLVARSQHKTFKIALVPNLNDWRTLRRHPNAVRPTADLASTAQRIAASELVVASSLHAIVVAEALGIPARWLRSPHEPPLKYLDYFEGTGRTGAACFESVADAMRGNVTQAPLDWDPEPLIAAFPKDLWCGAADRAPAPDQTG